MRVLFTTFAAPTHLGLQMPLAWSLAQAGHDVCVASQPNLVPTITAAGLPAAAVGEPLDISKIVSLGGRESPFDIARMVNTRSDTSDIVGALSIYGPIISGELADDAMLADLLRFARRWRPDVIVWDALTYAGAVCAHALDVPSVRMLFAMDHFSRLRDTYLQTTGTPVDPLTSWLQRRMDKLEVPRAPADRLDELALGTVTIDPLPAPFSVTGDHPRWDVRMVNAFGAAIQDWHLEPPDDGRPRICVTTGLSSRDFGLTPPPLDVILAGLGELEAEVVVTLSPDQLREFSDLPANVRPASLVPLDALLPTCSAIVHHFGTGTITAAMRHGVPQVHTAGPVDLWGESVLADILRRHGAAAHVPYAEATPGLVCDVTAGLLADDGATLRAQELQASYLQRETPHDLVRRFEQLI